MRYLPHTDAERGAACTNRTNGEKYRQHLGCAHLDCLVGRHELQSEAIERQRRTVHSDY